MITLLTVYSHSYVRIRCEKLSTRPESELSIYDTYKKSYQVKLFSDELLYCNMITGKKIIPFYTKDLEGFDINYPYDLKYASFLAKKKYD